MNQSNNSTSETAPPFAVIVTSTTMVIALCSNIFLVGVILRSYPGSKRKLTPVQILILHCCLSDICFALFSLLPQTIWFLTLPHFYGGYYACKFVTCIQMVPFYASPFILVAISIDRFIAIKLPFVAIRHKHVVHKFLAAAAWSAAVIFALGHFGAFHYEDGTCEVADIKFQRFYALFFSVIAWLIPSLLSATFYAFVVKEIFNSMDSLEIEPKKSSVSKFHLPRLSLGKASDQGSVHSKASTTMNFSRNHHKFRGSQISGNMMSDQAIKTVKLTLTIVAANFLLYTPFCVVQVLNTFTVMGERYPLLFTSVMLFGNMNSCVNPWIYMIYNRKQVIEIVCCRSRYGPNVNRRLTFYTGTTKSIRKSKSSKRSDPKSRKQQSATMINGSTGRYKSENPTSPPVTKALLHPDNDSRDDVIHCNDNSIEMDEYLDATVFTEAPNTEPNLARRGTVPILYHGSPCIV